MINRINDIAPEPGAGPQRDPSKIKRVICINCLRDIYESTRAILGMYGEITDDCSNIPANLKQHMKTMADFEGLIE